MSDFVSHDNEENFRLKKLLTNKTWFHQYVVSVDAFVESPTFSDFPGDTMKLYNIEMVIWPEVWSIFLPMVQPNFFSAFIPSKNKHVHLFLIHFLPLPPPLPLLLLLFLCGRMMTKSRALYLGDLCNWVKFTATVIGSKNTLIRLQLTSKCK